MDYFIVIFFIEFLLIGLSSIGFILAKRFLKFSYLRILLLSYSIFILLINYAYFNLSININLIFWFFSSIFAFSIIYLFFLDKKALIQKLKLILAISFIPLLIFLMLSIFYGEQYYVFGKTTNTFKLSHINSHMGDAAAISLTAVADAGTAHTLSSGGVSSVGVSWPGEENLAYKV